VSETKAQERGEADLGPRFGLLPGEKIAVMARRRMIEADRAFAAGQIQPASLDLRLGPKAYRVRASFLPGPARTVEELLGQTSFDEIDLSGSGAVLERGCVYVVPLQERLALPPSIAAVANPKSSTGRLDIFTRLIVDRSEMFDAAPAGYQGPLYAEVSPRSFSVRAREGSKLNQIRFRRLNSSQIGQTRFALPDRELRARHEASPLVDGELDLRDGLIVRVALSRDSLGDLIGYRAQKHADVVDVDRIGAYAVEEFWDPIRARPDARLILDPGEFYILASREKMRIPADLAAEMVPIDPAMGEFRVHYAGFFDPGFGETETGRPGARGVLEVRSHEVPFVLEDGQIIARLVFEKISEAPEALYGQGGASNYQGQALKLSKHFR
jgi:dCTP deaminase